MHVSSYRKMYNNPIITSNCKIKIKIKDKYFKWRPNSSRLYNGYPLKLEATARKRLTTE